MEQFRHIIKLNQSCLLAKTIDELEKQNKKIERRITHKGLTEEKRQNAEYITTAKQDIKSFL